MRKYKYHLLDNDLVREFKNLEIQTVETNATMKTLMLYLNEADKQMRESVPISNLEELIKNYNLSENLRAEITLIDDLQTLIDQNKQC